MKTLGGGSKMKAFTKIQPDSKGSGLYIRIPKDLVDELKWKSGARIFLETNGNSIKITPEVL